MDTNCKTVSKNKYVCDLSETKCLLESRQRIVGEYFCSFSSEQITQTPTNTSQSENWNEFPPSQPSDTLRVPSTEFLWNEQFQEILERVRTLDQVNRVPYNERERVWCDLAHLAQV